MTEQQTKNTSRWWPVGGQHFVPESKEIERRGQLKKKLRDIVADAINELSKDEKYKNATIVNNTVDKGKTVEGWYDEEIGTDNACIFNIERCIGISIDTEGEHLTVDHEQNSGLFHDFRNVVMNALKKEGYLSIPTDDGSQLRVIIPQKYHDSTNS